MMKLIRNYENCSEWDVHRVFFNGVDDTHGNVPKYVEGDGSDSPLRSWTHSPRVEYTSARYVAAEAAVTAAAERSEDRFFRYWGRKCYGDGESELPATPGECFGFLF